MIQQYTQILFLIGKLFFTAGAIIYAIFALVVVRQVRTMSKNVYDKFNTILIIFSYLHLAFSIFLIFLTLAVL
jgi:alanine dehydrogenase